MSRVNSPLAAADSKSVFSKKIFTNLLKSSPATSLVGLSVKASTRPLAIDAGSFLVKSRGLPDPFLAAFLSALVLDTEISVWSRVGSATALIESEVCISTDPSDAGTTSELPREGSTAALPVLSAAPKARMIRMKRMVKNVGEGEKGKMCRRVREGLEDELR